MGKWTTALYANACINSSFIYVAAGLAKQHKSSNACSEEKVLLTAGLLTC